jgi:hypothetical protein
MENFLFICGHRKSGTSLLNLLFDFHPELIVYPHDLSIMYGYYPLYINKKNNLKKKRFSSVAFSSFDEKLKRYNSPFQLENFKKNFFNSTEQKDFNDISILIKKLSKSFKSEFKMNFKSEDKYIVLKETGIEVYAQELKKKFKNSKFIQIVRDPRDNFSAIKPGINKHYKKIGESYNETLFNCINRIRTSLTFAKENERILGKKNYHIIRFEKLVDNPAREMKKICKFLDISFHKNLLKPTFFGNKTFGNSYDGQKKISISKKNSGRWKKRLNKAEINILEFFLNDLIKEFDYTSVCKTKNYYVTEYYKWFNYKYFYRDSFKKFK